MGGAEHTLPHPHLNLEHYNTFYLLIFNEIIRKIRVVNFAGTYCTFRLTTLYILYYLSFPTFFLENPAFNRFYISFQQGSDSLNKLYLENQKCALPAAPQVFYETGKQKISLYCCFLEIGRAGNHAINLLIHKLAFNLSQNSKKHKDSKNSSKFG